MLLIGSSGSFGHSISLVSQRFPIYSQPCATARLGGREAIWATVEMVLEFMGPGFICEHIIHAVKFQVYQDFWSFNEAC